MCFPVDELGARGHRQTIQFSKTAMRLIREVARIGNKSYTAVIRDALHWYLAMVAGGEQLPEPLPLDDPPRRQGVHGPMIRWEKELSLVLDAELKLQLDREAAQKELKDAALIRDILSRYLAYRAIWGPDQRQKQFDPAHLPPLDRPPRRDAPEFDLELAFSQGRRPSPRPSEHP